MISHTDGKKEKNYGLSDVNFHCLNNNKKEYTLYLQATSA